MSSHHESPHESQLEIVHQGKHLPILKTPTVEGITINTEFIHSSQQVLEFSNYVDDQNSELKENIIKKAIEVKLYD
jgi:hypothetical protein